MRLARRRCLSALAAAALALVVVACGDPAASTVDAAPGTADARVVTGDILVDLRATPGVVSVTEQPTQNAGYRYFAISFDQPVDHAHPEGQHFTQHLTLIHRDATAPMILLTTGYGNYYRDFPSELTRLLHANQLVIEHRFFTPSRPAPADWTMLTIQQGAADHHAIAQAFKPIYTAKWLATGASKGGMTSVYHQRFFPGDVDGTVPYVAPISFGAPDMTYDTIIDSVGTQACRDAVKAAQVDMLTNRRAALEQRATAQASAQGYSYTRIQMGPAVESAVQSVEWAFWQYTGIGGCADVPTASATDDVVFAWLDQVSGVSGSDDDSLAFFEPYYYQAEFQLGYPGTTDDHLTGLLMYGPSDYAGADPVGVTPPTFDPTAMTDVDAWVKSSGDRLLFVYGQWDPWSGGMFQLGNATDSARYVVAQGTHGSQLADLAPADRDAAFAMLARWTGVTPDLSAVALRRATPREPREPRVPPAVVQALRLRRAGGTTAP